MSVALRYLSTADHSRSTEMFRQPAFGRSERQDATHLPKPPRFFHEPRGSQHILKLPLTEALLGHCDVVCDEGVVFYMQCSSQWDGPCDIGQDFDVMGDGISPGARPSADTALKALTTKRR